MKNTGAVCFLGETENRGEELCRHIYSQVDFFLSSGACGFIFTADTEFGLMCARQVILRSRRQNGNRSEFIRLIAVIPYEEHICEKSEAFRDEYFDVLEKCDASLTFARDEQDYFQADFTQAIIDLSDVVICAEKSEYARLYASATGKKIIGVC